MGFQNLLSVEISESFGSNFHLSMHNFVKVFILPIMIVGVISMSFLFYSMCSHEAILR